MRLMHYTAEPLVFDRARTYEQPEPSTFGKPDGFWVSVEGEDDWPSWCRDEEFGLDRLKHAHSVTLAESAKVAVLAAGVGIDFFTSKYAIQTDRERDHADIYGGKPRLWPIDWRRVAAEWDGIIIAPYQLSRRFSHSWYYGWDCASGCIWNLDAIAAVEPAEAVVS